MIISFFLTNYFAKTLCHCEVASGDEAIFKRGCGFWERWLTRAKEVKGFEAFQIFFSPRTGPHVALRLSGARAADKSRMLFCPTSGHIDDSSPDGCRLWRLLLPGVHQLPRSGGSTRLGVEPRDYSRSVTTSTFTTRSK